MILWRDADDKKKKSLSDKFKAKVAIEAVKGIAVKLRTD
jgi:hypothetical protein